MLSLCRVMCLGLFLCSPSFSPSHYVCSAQNAVIRADETHLVAFEVASIKPSNPTGHGAIGFYSYPGGRVFVGQSTITDIMAYAFDLQRYQVVGLPAWASDTRYDVTALKPSEEIDVSQHVEAARPSANERIMLQTLLVQRFGLVSHSEKKVGTVYLLQRGKGPLAMVEAKDKMGDPRGGVFMKAGGVADGEAAGRNLTMGFLAKQIAASLERPVIDKTGLTGGYDFHLAPNDPTNHDMTLAIFRAMERLGLKLKSAKAPVETRVVDRVSKPTEN